MTRRRVPVSGNLAGAVLAVVVIAVGFVIAFWEALLTTVLILAVPFGIWWFLDYQKRKSAQWEAERHAAMYPPPRVNPEHEARMADELGLPDSAKFWRDQPRFDR